MASEKRLTDLDSLLEKVTKLVADGGNTAETVGNIIIAITDAPIADAVEVVHGRWEQGDYYDYGDVCSVCDWDSAREPCKLSYCPNCGAKMDGDGNG